MLVRMDAKIRSLTQSTREAIYTTLEITSVGLETASHQDSVALPR